MCFTKLCYIYSEIIKDFQKSADMNDTEQNIGRKDISHGYQTFKRRPAP